MRTMKTYETPTLDVITLEVEQGFATTGKYGGQDQAGGDVNIKDWEEY